MPAESCADEKKTSICICTCICTFVPVKPVKLSTERPEVARRVVLRREEGLLQNASGHKDAVGRVAGATKKVKNAKQRRRGEKNREKTRRVFRERSYSERRRASAEERGGKKIPAGTEMRYTPASNGI